MTGQPSAAEAHALLERVIDLDPAARAAALDEFEIVFQREEWQSQPDQHHRQ